MTLALLVLLTLWSQQNGLFAPQRGIIDAARRLHADAPRTLRIGDTDSGYLGYFSRHTVVNLDGVVNNRAERAIADGVFDTYVASQALDEVRVDPMRLPFYNRNMQAAVVPNP